jgi:hypothetical protein
MILAVHYHHASEILDQRQSKERQCSATSEPVRLIELFGRLSSLHAYGFAEHDTSCEKVAFIPATPIGNEFVAF